jgi:hypothetical protein
MKKTILALLAVMALVPSSLAQAALAQSAKYETVLDPAPLTFATRNDVAGTGSVTAELRGNMLIVNGSFAGLPSPATTAQLRSGLLTGVPGDAFADLTVPHSPGGTITGSVKASRAIIAALKRGGLYVQLNSEKAPNGNLWGWLAPVS